MKRTCFSSMMHGTAVLVVWSLVSLASSSRTRAELFEIPPGDTAALIAAITLANTSDEPDTIRLHAGAYTLTLTDNTDSQGNGNGLPVVTSVIAVVGAGPEATFITRETTAPPFRLFHIASTGDLSLEGVTLAGGMAREGGGIRNEGTLRLHDTTLTDNEVRDQDLIYDTLGGALYNGYGGRVEVSDSLFVGNIADSGGAIANSGQMNLTDVSILDNSTTNDTFASGAGIACLRGEMDLVGVTIANNSAQFGLGGAIRNDCEATLLNVTISGNRARRWGAIWGRGLAFMSVTNSTITGNAATSVEPPVANIVGGIIAFTNSIVANSTMGENCYVNNLFLSGGHNIDSDGSCRLERAGDITGVSPVLGPLQDNGGATLTHALLPESPAIDAADNSKCPPRDQRGIERPQDGDVDGAAVCDIGAFELEAPNTSPEAEVGPDELVECTGPGGSTVSLEGSGSSDPDSTPDTNDDIVSFEWFEDFGLPTERPIGSGASLQLFLSLGSHQITLRVTDRGGLTDTDDLVVTVVDTLRPILSVALSPTVLWPPNHRMVGVTARVTVSDSCGPAAMLLRSVASSEPDDALGGGDGQTLNDIEVPDIGTPGLAFRLRAERDGHGDRRVYTVTYSARDSSGNTADATGLVIVPHDQSLGTEPVIISVSDSDAGTLIDWTDVPGAIQYDIVRGDVRSLRETESSIDLGAVVCVEAGSVASTISGHEDSDVPDPGKAFFYLVAYDDGWGGSGYGAANLSKPRIVASGDCR